MDASTFWGLVQDQCLFRLVRSFYVCPSNERKRRLWKRSEFWVGQCSFPDRHDWPNHGGFAHPPGLTAEQSRDLDAELVARMGVPLARIDLRVRCKDQRGFDLDFSQADVCVAAFTSRGIDLALMLHMPYGSDASLILPHYREVTGSDRWRYPIQEAPYRHYVREVAKRYGKYAYAFHGSGRRQVALFALGEPIRVTLTSNARRALLIDPMGNSSPAGQAQQVTIQAGTYPQTVVFQGATEVKLRE